MSPLFGFFEGALQPMHLLLLLVIGILLFGNRLPEIGRSLGKGLVEFKKGLKGLEDEVQGTTTVARQEPAALQPPRPPQRVPTTGPTFDNPTGPTTPPQA